jgi:hypothetical protein
MGGSPWLLDGQRSRDGPRYRHADGTRLAAVVLFGARGGNEGGTPCTPCAADKKKPAMPWKHAGFESSETVRGREMVPATGIELVTYALRVRCSTD